MHQYCLCKLFHLPKKVQANQKKIGYKNNGNTNLSQFALFLGKIFLKNLNKLLLFGLETSARSQKNRFDNILWEKTSNFFHRFKSYWLQTALVARNFTVFNLQQLFLQIHPYLLAKCPKEDNEYASSSSLLPQSR